MINLSSIDQFLTYATAAFGAFLAALWLSLIFWTFRDIRARSQDRLIQVLAVLLVTILTIPGYFIYLLVRPPMTLDEAYQRTLEEEALLSQIEDRPICPGCGGRTAVEWQVCANCHTRLRKECLNCGKLMELPWQVCPFCSTPASSNSQTASSPDFGIPGNGQ
jgi:hypothetical protein